MSVQSDTRLGLGTGSAWWIRRERLATTSLAVLGAAVIMSTSMAALSAGPTGAAPVAINCPPPVAVVGYPVGPATPAAKGGGGSDC